MKLGITKNTTKWEVNSMLAALCESCAGNKPYVARQKGNRFFKIIEKMIAFTIEDAEKHELLRREYLEALNAFRDGKIRFDGGYLALSEIQGIAQKDDKFVITTKTGKEIGFPVKNGFGYIRHLYKEIW